MSKFNLVRLRATILIVLSICAVSFIVITACRKITLTGNHIEKSIEAREKFFRMPASAHPVVKAIAKNIFRQDQQRNFVSALAEKAGFPLWDKARIIRPQNNSQTQYRGGGSSTEIVLLPFVKEGQYVTNAVLAAIISVEQDTTFKLLYATNYADFGFNTRDTTVPNARDVFHLFTSFDKYLFGYSLFSIKDKRLFPTRGIDTSRPVTVRLRTTPFDVAERQIAFQICDIYDVCYGPTGYSEWQEEWCADDGGCTVNCQYWHHTETACSTIWIDIGGGGNGSGGGIFDGGGSGGGGGGNGGGGGSWENTNPCRLPPPGEPNPCAGGGGNGGWVPIVDLEDEIVGIENFLNWDVTPADFLQIKYWMTHNIKKDKLDSCRQIILDKLLTQTGSIGKILSKMDRSLNSPGNLEKFKVEYKFGATLPAANATTGSSTYNPVTKVFSTIVTIDSNYARSATDLSVAQTLIHETVHAYLKSLFFRRIYGITIPQIDAMTYGTLFSTFADTLQSYNASSVPQYLNNTDFQHSYMASYLLDAMSDALKQFDNSSISYDRYYWFLSWKGLYSSKTWQYHWSNYPSHPMANPAPSEDSTRGVKFALTASRLDSINNAHVAENYATPNAKGKKPIPGGCY